MKEIPSRADFLKAVQEQHPQMKPKEDGVADPLFSPAIQKEAQRLTSAETLRVFISHEARSIDITLQPENIPAVGDALVYHQGGIKAVGMVTVAGVIINADDYERETKFVIISFSEKLEFLQAISASIFSHKFPNSSNSELDIKLVPPEGENPVSEPKTSVN